MCFVCISEQTAIISLYNINGLVFITETECVYCEVGLYIYIYIYVCVCNYFFSNPLKPTGYFMYRQFNIHKFCVLPTQCIYVFCVDLRTNSDYFPRQH